MDLGRRAGLGWAAGMVVVLTGCSEEPTVCSLAMLLPSVSVDVLGLPIDPFTTEARICLDDDCAVRPVQVVVPVDPGDPSSPAPPTYDQAPESAEAVWFRDIPDRATARVSLVLTDRDSGEELYRGEGTAATEVVEPNGPGCGEVRTLEPLTAETDGRLTA